jgi:rubrerythrin
LKAEEEGFHNLARLFRALAESETVHAIRHLESAKDVRSSLENIEESWKGEKKEYSGMYSMFMDQAKRDVNNDALQTFFWANESEKIDVQIAALHVCTVCGNTLEGDLPDTCPVCGKSRDSFVVID